MNLVIVDYGVGNLANVVYAWRRLGENPIVTGDADVIRTADLIELPGVGAMRDAVRNLKERKLVEVLTEKVHSGTFLLGVCLGMQALFECSHEGGKHETLGFLPGEVVPFRTHLKVPHMGWNELNFVRRHWLENGLPARPYVYFVHSYHKVPVHTDDVIAATEYDGAVPAICGRDNVLGMQFHPEKSGAVGSRLLENILTYVRKE